MMKGYAEISSWIMPEVENKDKEDKVWLQRLGVKGSAVLIVSP